MEPGPGPPAITPQKVGQSHLVAPAFQPVAFISRKPVPLMPA